MSSPSASASQPIRLVLVGGGGHARVLLDLVRACNASATSQHYEIEGYYDDHGGVWAEIKWLGTIDKAEQPATKASNGSKASRNASSTPVPSSVQWVCAIGDNAARQRMVERLPGRTWATLLHPSAVLSPSARVGAGSQLCALSVLQTGATVGEHCILNTSCSVDHDCSIGSFVHVSPGVHLCGAVEVDAGTLMGVSSCAIPRVKIGWRCVIGAGSTVLVDVPNGRTAVGIIKDDKQQQSAAAMQLLSPSERAAAALGAASVVTSLQSKSSSSSSSSVAHARVPWLPKKHVKWSLVQQYMAASESRNHFSNGGPAVKALEHHLMTLLAIEDHKTVILVNNGSSAIHALVSAFKLQTGKAQRFATQSFTFPASAQGSCAGAKIVDVDAEGGLDLQLLSPSDVDGIIVTNCFGHLTDLDRYEQWCAQHGKLLIFDNAATSFSQFVRHRPSNSALGLAPRNSLNFGTAATVSFHHTKPAGFGEGGAIVVDKRWEAAVRRIMNFGYDVPLGDVQWQPQGNNFKMADVAAGFIHAYLHDLPTIVREHALVYEEVARRVAQLLPPVRLFPNRSAGTPFASCVPLLFSSGVSEELVVRESQMHGMDLRKYYKPLDPSAPVSASLYSRIVCFPCHRDMQAKDIDTLMHIVHDIQAAMTKA